MSAGLEWVHRNPGVFMSGHRDRWGSAQMGQVDWEGVAKAGGVLVDEMSIPEFAYATGMSEQVARSLIHDAVVMFYRFPRTWARMSAGQVPIWRARLVPRLGAAVEMKVARYVDRHLDQAGARFTRAHIQRLIDEARLRYTPDEVATEVAASAEQRGVDIDTRGGAHLGVADVRACLDLPDALDLEAALAQGAAQLKAAGSTEPLDVRRAQALGDLARTAQTPHPPTLTFANDEGMMIEETGEGSGRVRWDGKGVAKTGVKIYIHLNHTALRCTCTTPPEPPPSTPATGTAPPISAFGGTALSGAAFEGTTPTKTAASAADATFDSSPKTTATGTAPPASAFGARALGEGLPGGSFVEYFIKGPGPKPGPGVTPAPDGPVPGSEGFLMPDVTRREDHLGEVCRVDGTGMPTAVLAPGTIRGWFTRPRAFDYPGVKISVQQVLDPQEFISSQAYEVPQRARQATILTGRSCVFPYCHAIAERADCDHITPYDQGGPSCTCNLAALCRFHHRLKTHGQHHPDHKWTYAPLGEGKYVWQGPNDIHLLRTPTGTHVLPGDIFTTRPTDGQPTPGIRYPDGTTTGFDEHHPAFAAVTEPLALPHSDPQGHPRPVPEVTLMQQRLRQRAKDPEANTYYQRYAAAGKHLARPEIEYCQLPPQTTTTQPNNDNNAVEHDHKNDTDHTPGPFYNPEPPPF